MDRARERGGIDRWSRAWSVAERLRQTMAPAPGGLLVPLRIGPRVGNNGWGAGTVHLRNLL